ncbi:MAG TPA: pitrilysin family protein [Pyrinomonadaceae bacterium]|nr:pitrilysin family protein [Pyrinomonadaceae bacterium]
METPQALLSNPLIGRVIRRIANRGSRQLAGAIALALLFAAGSASQLAAQSTHTPQASAGATTRALTPAAVADTAKLVTEFEVNGLKVLVKRREGSQTAVLGLFVRGGASNVNEKNAGVEALMLNLASEATVNYPRERMRSESSRMGTQISYGINYDYSVLTMGTTRRNFDRSWQMFTDVALHPSFLQEDFDRIKNQMVVARSDDQDTPDSYLAQLQSRSIYAGHPYLNDPSGTAESLKGLTLDDVKRYYAQVMQTSRLLLVVVGDVDPQQIKMRVAASLGKLPRGNYQTPALPALSFANSTVDITSRDLPTNYVMGTFVAPSMTMPDIYAMRVASSVLQTRVFTEVRVRRNLSYAPDAFLNSQRANVGGIYVTAVDANQAVRVMLEEIERLQQEPLTADDIKSSIQQFLTRYYIGQQTNAAQAGELAQYELIGGGWRNSADFIDHLRVVTPADVQRVSQKYMHNIRFVVLGNPKSIDSRIFTGQAAGQ